MLVEMERSYISAGFFRSTMYNRTNKIKEQEAMMAAGQKATAKGVPAASGGAGAAPKGKSYFPAFGGKEADAEPAPAANAEVAPEDGSDDGAKGAAGGSHRQMMVEQSPRFRTGAGTTVRVDCRLGTGFSWGPPVTHLAMSCASHRTLFVLHYIAASTGFGGSMNDPNDFVAAYFDKSGSDDSALTFGSLKWQRRFFIFSDSQRMLYYFKSPDDVPKVTQGGA